MDQSASSETVEQQKTEKPEREPKKYRNTKKYKGIPGQSFSTKVLKAKFTWYWNET